MDEKNLKIIRYLTGIIFAAEFITSAFDLAYDLGYYYSLEKVLCVIKILGWLLMAISLFAGAYSLLTIGTGMQSASILVGVLAAGYRLSNILLLIAFVLVALAVQQRKNSITIGIVSAALITVQEFLVWSAELGYPFGMSVMKTFSCSGTFWAAAIVLTCLIVQNAPQTQSVTIKQSASAQKTDNRIEALTKLKDLLDAGAITQEEFDTKKKQFLGM